MNFQIAFEPGHQILNQTFRFPLVFTPLGVFSGAISPLDSLWIWAQFPPDHVQVAQRKQHIELGIVLLDSLVAGLLVQEGILHHVKRVLYLGSDEAR